MGEDKKFDLSISWDDMKFSDISVVLRTIDEFVESPDNIFITKKDESIEVPSLTKWLQSIRGTTGEDETSEP